MKSQVAFSLNVAISVAALCLFLEGVRANPFGAPTKGNVPESCSTQQTLETPCRCCKMDCWYTIAQSATHELGHVPGQAGEEEAMATLKLIRSCMIAECSGICPRRRPPPLFAPQ